MADKKLNEVSQLTDFDYALVVKGNDVAKVTKQQLATILGELIGIKKVKKTIIATLEGSIIYSEVSDSCIISCTDGAMSFNLMVVSNLGNIRYSIINGAIRQGYSIYVDGSNSQYLRIKRDKTVTDKEFNFTLFNVT